MFKHDAEEAVPLCQTVLGVLLQSTNTQGQTGAAMRTAVGDFLATALRQLQTNSYGPAFTDIFAKSILAGVTQAQLANIADIAAAQTTQTLGATLVKNVLVEFALATECKIITTMTFASRNQVNGVKQVLLDQFAPLIETVADQMDQMTFQALVELQAAIINYLVTTEQPLPRVLNYQFASIMPTLVQAQKLYQDASRADELLAENDVVHPAFAPRIGLALSS
jgi:prophage DNA circulation protein